MVYYSHFAKITVFETVFQRLEKAKFWLFVFCALFGFAYFWQVNSLSTRGFKIRELENNIESLREVNQKLEMNAANAQSINQLQEKIKELNMVAPAEVEYLRPVGSGVAFK